ncbi:hypothetical protein ABPG77_004313 [Micractinium sp. CCAP 211/92]
MNLDLVAAQRRQQRGLPLWSAGALSASFPHSAMHPCWRAPAEVAARAPDLAAFPSLTSLPDELLLRIFEELDFTDVMNHVACVSKRLCSLCLSPQLVRSLGVTITCGHQQLARCKVLLAFLTTHGQHIQELYLHVEQPADNGESAAGLAAAVASCLGALSGSGSLQQLVLLAGTPVSSYAWLSGLTGLRLLHVGQQGAALQCPPGIS